MRFRFLSTNVYDFEYYNIMNVMDKSTVRSRKRYPRTLSPTNFDNILPSKPMNTDQSICSSKTTATYYSFEKNA